MRSGAFLGGLFAGGFLAGGALGQPVGDITDPVWRSLPSGEQRGAAYPLRAAANKKIGVAVVRCTAEADGALSACELVCETPAKWGFGKAALGLAHLHRLEPLLPDGRPVGGGTVAVAFRFNPPFLAPLPRCDGKG